MPRGNVLSERTNERRCAGLPLAIATILTMGIVVGIVLVSPGVEAGLFTDCKDTLYQGVSIPFGSDGSTSVGVGICVPV